MTPAASDAVVVRIYFRQSSRFGNLPLFRALCEMLLRAGVRGATVFEGSQGFGFDGTMSSDSGVDATGDLPMVVEVIDAKERVATFLPELDRMLHDGLVTVQPIRAIVLR